MMGNSDPLAAKPIAIANAYLDSHTTIVAQLTDRLTFPVAAASITVTDATEGKAIPVTAVSLPQTASSVLVADAQPPSFVSPGLTPTSLTSIQTDQVAVILARAPDVSHRLHITSRGGMPVLVIPRLVLSEEQYFYPGDDLGNTYRPEATAFRLWAPTASDVQLLLYESHDGPLCQQIAMQPDDNGTWYVQVRADLKNRYYLYQVIVHGTTRYAVDPYARAIAPNGTRGMIVDLSETDPPGWLEDQTVALAHPEDAIIYEVHVRDFSIDPNSGMVHRGKYLAFTEQGTRGPDNVATGVESLKELGITHVQLQPIQAFASVDENDPAQYNWGYDPRNYNVPTGAYATTPYGTARITECKQMIQSLHQQGIGVILDVVYNHTFTTHDSDFDKIVPQYYYRTDSFGHYTNGSGVGNELATERPMVQKFMLDSLIYWVKQYHVDGFRFDLMALHGVQTMKLVERALHALNPHLLLFGEPWAGGTSALPAASLLIKGRQKGLGLAVFNDQIRDGLNGNVFDRTARGFATGAEGQVEVIRKAVEGSIDTFTTSPAETINYVSSHDDYTLWDKIASSNPFASEEERIKMDELAQAVILTAQGLAFLHGGEEMLRTKGGNGNSYNAGDAVNRFDWARKARYWKVFNYYAGLIHLRKAHPAFRMTSARDICAHLSFLESPENTLMFVLGAHANGDSWENILVIYNPTRAPVICPLPPGRWTIVLWQDRLSDEFLGHASGRVMVPAISCMILYR